MGSNNLKKMKASSQIGSTLMYGWDIQFMLLVSVKLNLAQICFAHKIQDL